MKRLIRKSRVFIFLVIVALVGVMGTIGIVYASQQTDVSTYYIAVDQKGHMRLLLLDVKGKHEDECCKGKVTQLTLQYNGSEAADIRVEQKKEGNVFTDTIASGETFTFNGIDKNGTLGTEISIYVNGEFNTNIHTSCSRPIGPGLVSGAFEVVEGYSKDGGLLCPIASTTDVYGELKKNEFMIELPSSQLVSELVAALDAKIDELGDNVTDVENIISVLESVVSEQGGKIIELGGTVNEQSNNLTTLWDRIVELEGTVAQQADNITALWERIAEQENQQGSFTIPSTVGAGGSISPSGTVTVAQGASQTFTVTADTGYLIADVLVDGSSVGVVSTYTFPNVNANHTIEVSFAENPTGDIVTEGLVLYLPLYELDGATFASKDQYGHLCTVTEAVWTPQGFLFDGTNDVIASADNSGLSGDAVFSFEIWFKAVSLTNWDVLVSVSGASGTLNACTLTLMGDGDVGLSFGGANNAHVGEAISTGTWYHLVAVKTAGAIDATTNIYLDGIPQALDGNESSNAPNVTEGVATVGAYSGFGFANCYIGEVRIYNRALTPLEIQQNYLATKQRYE